MPHITDAIQEWVMKQARVSVDDDGVEPQVCVIEVRLSNSCVPISRGSLRKCTKRVFALNAEQPSF